MVIAGSEYKLKYAGSVFGYAWSIVKPLALFTVLYLVFARVFKLGTISDYYAVSLLIGIVLFGFFADATSLGMTSLVARESLLRKLVFPRLVIPMAATITAGDHVPGQRGGRRRLRRVGADHAAASTGCS